MEVKPNIWRAGLARTFSPKYLFSDLFKVSGQKRVYLLALLAIQLVSFFIVFSNGHFLVHANNTTIGNISLLASVTGVFSVVLVANGRITNYFWGILNSCAYIYVSFDSHLYGEVYLNLFFIVMDLVGIYQWTKADQQQAKTKATQEKVVARTMSVKGWLLMAVILVVSWLLLAAFLSRVPFITATIDPHPYMDSMSTVLQVGAMVLMAFRFGASQWVLWNISHVAELVLWTLNFNPIMLALWLAFSINSVYGFYVWTFQLREQKVTDEAEVSE